MASYKNAVETMCKECIYDKEDTGSWRMQVEKCEVKSCPLWCVRPITSESERLVKNGTLADLHIIFSVN